MKSSNVLTLGATAIPVAALLLLPVTASAHETQQFRIGGETYQFVIGSVNEPVTVDDKSGVEVEISRIDGDHHAAEEDHHAAGDGVAGLEEALTVEIAAAGKTKALALRPKYGEVGTYYATFFPTVATTYSYRLIGTINDTPVDLTFTCAAAGHGEAEEDTSIVEISEGVTRISKTGAFSCPAAKEDLGFPEPSVSIASLAETTSGTSSTSFAALGLSIFALLAAGYVAMKKR